MRSYLFAKWVLSDQSWPGNKDDNGVRDILQSSSITRASPSDCVMSYVRHWLEESYTFVEMQYVYSAAPAVWAIDISDLIR